MKTLKNILVLLVAWAALVSPCAGMRYEQSVNPAKGVATWVEGPNAYAYVGQNPWTKFDPLGLFEDSDGNGGGIKFRVEEGGYVNVIDVPSHNYVETAAMEVRVNDDGGKNFAKALNKYTAIRQSLPAGPDYTAPILYDVYHPEYGEMRTMALSMGMMNLNPNENWRGGGGARGGTQINPGVVMEPPTPTSSARGDRARAQLMANQAKGSAFEQETTQVLKNTQDNVATQVTVRTASGTKVRLDNVGTDKATGAVKLTDAKSSATAGFTPNQTAGYPEIEQSGGVVAGRGKPGYPGGTQIPPTTVDVIRPNNKLQDAKE